MKEFFVSKKCISSRQKEFFLLQNKSKWFWFIMQSMNGHVSFTSDIYKFSVFFFALATFAFNHANNVDRRKSNVQFATKNEKNTTTTKLNGKKV